MPQFLTLFLFVPIISLTSGHLEHADFGVGVQKLPDGELTNHNGDSEALKLAGLEVNKEFQKSTREKRSEGSWVLQ